MLHKTKGIVLSFTDYSETSIVARIYTESFGMLSFLVNGVRKRGARVRSNMFEPLTLLEMVIYYKENRGLQRISEIHASPSLSSISIDIRKTSVAIFLAEVLCKAIREEEANSGLYSFIEESVLALDREQEPVGTFHTHFLVQLTRYLGFYPGGAYSAGAYFDLREGIFVTQSPQHPEFLDPDQSRVLALSLQGIGADALQGITARARRQLLADVLEYCRLHIPSFGQIQSLAVLEEVFR